MVPVPNTAGSARKRPPSDMMRPMTTPSMEITATDFVRPTGAEAAFDWPAVGIAWCFDAPVFRGARFHAVLIVPGAPYAAWMRWRTQRVPDQTE